MAENLLHVARLAGIDPRMVGVTLDEVGLAERRNLERIVGEENADRNAVYREIAIANGHPEWEGDIRGTFARQWNANARSGWYYQQSDGSWAQK